MHKLTLCSIFVVASATAFSQTFSLHLGQATYLANGGQWPSWFGQVNSLSFAEITSGTSTDPVNQEVLVALTGFMDLHTETVAVGGFEHTLEREDYTVRFYVRYQNPFVKTPPSASVQALVQTAYEGFNRGNLPAGVFGYSLIGAGRRTVPTIPGTYLFHTQVDSVNGPSNYLSYLGGSNTVIPYREHLLTVGNWVKQNDGSYIGYCTVDFDSGTVEYDLINCLAGNAPQKGGPMNISVDYKYRVKTITSGGTIVYSQTGLW